MEHAACNGYNGRMNAFTQLQNSSHPGVCFKLQVTLQVTMHQMQGAHRSKHLPPHRIASCLFVLCANSPQNPDLGDLTSQSTETLVHSQSSCFHVLLDCRVAEMQTHLGSSSMKRRCITICSSRFSYGFLPKISSKSSSLLARNVVPSVEWKGSRVTASALLAKQLRPDLRTCSKCVGLHGAWSTNIACTWQQHAHTCNMCICLSAGNQGQATQVHLPISWQTGPSHTNLA